MARPARRWKPPRPRLLQSQADLAKAKANAVRGPRPPAETRKPTLSRVKALLQYTQIRAPYAGVVTERNVNRGDFVQPAGTTTAKPLLTVARTDMVRIFVDVPEMDSPWVEAGRTGYVNVQALPDRTVEGKVTRTSWALGANRTLRTELDLPNPERPAAAGHVRHGPYPAPGAPRRSTSCRCPRSFARASKPFVGSSRTARRRELRSPSGSRSETKWR